MGLVGLAAQVAILALAAMPISAQRSRPPEPSPPQASTAATRLAILAAEDRRAPTPRDLETIRAGARSADGQTMRIAVRALGRLERPELVADIIPGLQQQFPEVRAEAANALAQAARGWAHRPPASSPRSLFDAASAALLARLRVEADGNVRSAIAGAIGRLPYTSVEQTDNAERTLLDLLARSQSVADRVGVASGLEALVRTRRALNAPALGAIEALRGLAAISSPQPSTGAGPASSPLAKAGAVADPARNARVRRLALEALITTESADDDVVRRAADDPDSQVRRLAMRALPARGVMPRTAGELLHRGQSDSSAMVRLEALRAMRMRGEACASALDAARDSDPHVALVAIDQLAGCASAEATAWLEQAVGRWAEPGAPRTWHRPAHALVALATSAPAGAAAELPRFAASRTWQLRMYAARTAAVLRDRGTLDRLATDDDDNVREAAIDALVSVAGHGADQVYIDALARGGYQVIRAAARALAGTAATGAASALQAAWRRLVTEGYENSLDARSAVAETLRGLGVSPEPAAMRSAPATASVTASDLRRIASARARVTIRGVGRFDLALIGAEAPASVLRFVRLAESGYYNGLTFHRVVPNFVIQGGSPGANEYIGDKAFLRDELGQWPHVRGAVGISTRGRDTGDAQIFIDLVDNPRLDHEYTVFAHVLNGMDVVDAILEGDVIDKIEIVPGP